MATNQCGDRLVSVHILLPSLRAGWSFLILPAKLFGHEFARTIMKTGKAHSALLGFPNGRRDAGSALLTVRYRALVDSMHDNVLASWAPLRIPMLV